MAKIKQKAGPKPKDPSLIKKNVAVYREQREIDEHGGIDNLKEKINYFVENMHPIKLSSGNRIRRNVITMQVFTVHLDDENYITGTYDGTDTLTKIPINIFETFFR